MYVGSADFIAANTQPIQKHRISGTIDGEAFGPANLLAGSVSINNQCSDNSDAKIGAVYIGTFKATFLTNTGISATTWQGREIVVNFELLTQEDPETWEVMPMGIYTVAEAQRTMQGIQIIAYDNMSKFDKPVSWEYLPAGSIHTILMDICSKCNVTLGMSSSDCEALVNGDNNAGLYPGSDCTTYRDIIYWLSQYCAGFATINRSGALVIRSYKTILDAAGAVPVLPYDRRLTGATISDYTTNFVGLYLYNMKDDEIKYYGTSNSGPIYDLGANPFMQYGTASQIKSLADHVFDGIRYHLRPFKASIMSAPVWDLGDRIRLTGGIASGYDTVTVIHSISYSSGKGTELQCFGANPALNASGTQSKSGSAARSSSASNNTTFKRYANNNEITVSAFPDKVVDITFTAEKGTDFDVWHEILLESALGTGSDHMEIEAVYYLDGIELERKPVETYTDNGKHILTLNYSENVTEGNHNWQVYLSASGGTATIDTSAAIAVLKGQGLVKSDGWDGILVITDSTEIYDMIIEARPMLEGVNVEINDDIPIGSIEDQPAPEDYDIPAPVPGENINIVLVAQSFQIITQSGDHIITQSGSKYINTEA